MMLCFVLTLLCHFLPGVSLPTHTLFLLPSLLYAYTSAWLPACITGVCTVVQQKIEQEAALGVPLAKILLGKVNRKTVKQTVMTYVYGVTMPGAREQISNRLKERKDIVWAEPMEKSIHDAALYLAKLTFSSLGDVFKGARGIMEWLTQCAQLISSTGQPVSWFDLVLLCLLWRVACVCVSCLLLLVLVCS